MCDNLFPVYANSHEIVREIFYFIIFLYSHTTLRFNLKYQKIKIITFLHYKLKDITEKNKKKKKNAKVIEKISSRIHRKMKITLIHSSYFSSFYAVDFEICSIRSRPGAKN